MVHDVKEHFSREVLQKSMTILVVANVPNFQVVNDSSCRSMKAVSYDLMLAQSKASEVAGKSNR